MKNLLALLALATVLVSGCSQEGPQPPSPVEQPPETNSDGPQTSSPVGVAEDRPADGIDVSQPVDDPAPDENGVYRYVVGSKLTEPRELQRGEIEVDLSTGEQAIKASMVAEVVIDIDGTVRDGKILRGVNPELDGAFIKSLKGYLFEPATLNGRPVPVKFFISVRIEGS